MDHQENYLRTIEFRYPEWIPVSVSLLPGAWAKYREDLEDLVIRHPIIFGEYKKGNRNFDSFSGTYSEGTHTDEWGCVWENIQGGLNGQVVGHPIKSWDEVKDYEPPDPMAGHDWDKIGQSLKEAREQ